MILHPYADAVTLDAARVLAHADRHTPRRPVVWAMGVHLVSRPRHLATWPPTVEALAGGPRGAGVGLRSGRTFLATPAGWDLREQRPDPIEVAKPFVLLRGTWAEVVDAIDPERVGEALVTEVRRVVEWGERVEAYFDWERRVGRGAFDEAQRRELAEMDAARQAINRLEREVTARIWDACRPPGAGHRTPVQLAGGAVPRPLRGRKVVAAGQMPLFG